MKDSEVKEIVHKDVTRAEFERHIGVKSRVLAEQLKDVFRRSDAILTFSGWRFPDGTGMLFDSGDRKDVVAFLKHAIKSIEYEEGVQ